MASHGPAAVVAKVTSTTLAIATFFVHAASSLHVFARLRLAVLAHLRLAARLPHLLGQEPAVGGYQSNSAHKSRPSVLEIAKFIYT